MIVEIALGIVLAVIILRLLPAIIGVGIVLFFVLLVAAACGLLIYWVGYHTNDVSVILTIGGVMAVASVLANYTSKKTGLTPGEVGFLIFLAPVTALFGWLIVDSYQSSSDFQILFWLIAPLAIWVTVAAILRIQLRRRLRVSAPEPHVKSAP